MWSTWANKISAWLLKLFLTPGGSDSELSGWDNSWKLKLFSHCWGWTEECCSLRREAAPQSGATASIHHHHVTVINRIKAEIDTWPHPANRKWYSPAAAGSRSLRQQQVVVKPFVCPQGAPGSTGKIYFVMKVSFKGALKEHYTQKIQFSHCLVTLMLVESRVSVCLFVGRSVGLSAASQRTSGLIAMKPGWMTGLSPQWTPLTFSHWSSLRSG